VLSAYRHAFGLVGRVRALPRTVDPAAALAFASSEPAIEPNQKEEEILWLLHLLAAVPPKVVLEIGTDRGGTLFLWTRVAADDALLVTLDLRKMVGRLGRLSPFALGRTSFARARQRVELIDDADSHDPMTVHRVRRLLGGRPVDFLFIDGDHRYEGVRTDFELYEPLVAHGGLVAFHDVSPRTTSDTVGTARFWAELKAAQETDERVAAGGPGYGIGVYRKR
jgi:predicted O-methyltransferase YrrM